MNPLAKEIINDTYKARYYNLAKAIRNLYLRLKK